RDIKPSNVLCVDGKVKVLDFGIAVAATKIENLAGTVDYMAPEILKGHPPSVASDLYAVGILAYQMMTGRYPYSRTSQTGFLRGVFKTESDVTLSGEIAGLLSHYNTNRTFEDGIEEGFEGALKLEELTGPVGAVVLKLLARQPRDR